MDIKNTLIGATVLGAGTLGTALGLQYAYKKFDFYPPDPVFYFFTGALAFAILEFSGVHEKLKALTA